MSDLILSSPPAKGASDWNKFIEENFDAIKKYADENELSIASILTSLDNIANTQLPNKVSHGEYGLGNSAIAVDDCNDIYDSGFYRLASTAQNSFGAARGVGVLGEVLISLPWNGGTRAQIAVSSDGYMGFRKIHAGQTSWGTWKQLATTSNSFTPATDNAQDIGSALARWRNIYAASGTINTSDEREKTDIIALDSEQSIAFLMALEPVSHKFVDGSRSHYGLVSQQVKKAMDSIGLTDMDFAGWIKSPVYVEGHEDLPEAEREIIDYTYGLRYTEFIPLLLKVLQEQQKQIEVLEGKVE